MSRRGEASERARPAIGEKFDGHGYLVQGLGEADSRMFGTTQPAWTLAPRAAGGWTPRGDRV